MPKRTANKTTWDNFRKKAEDVRKENARREKDYKKDLAAYEAEKKRRDEIARKYSAKNPK